MTATMARLMLPWIVAAGFAVERCGAWTPTTTPSSLLRYAGGSASMVFTRRKPIPSLSRSLSATTETHARRLRSDLGGSCESGHADTDSSVARKTHLSKRRREVLSLFSSSCAAMTSGVVATSSSPQPARAFEGGVGGLGKTKPETGVVFRDPDVGVTGGESGVVSCELLAPDGTPVLVTFAAPWPLLRGSGSIESRDLANPEAAFVQVAPLPLKGGRTAAELRKDFFAETVFGQAGKFGAYGAPSDIRVKRLIDSPAGEGDTAVYAATFTTLTPAMRESDRTAYISASVVGDGVFMLVTGTTQIRFAKQEKTLRRVADSFAAVAAPKSSLRAGGSGGGSS